MNDNEKFKKFFGFGGTEQGQEESTDTAAVEPVADAEALEKANAAVAEWHDKYLSLSADFQNYKKRIDTDKADWSFQAQKKVFMDMLDIVDNFERALDQERKRNISENESSIAGIEMIYQSIIKMMNKFGVQEITDFSSFNPKYHEALVQVESADKKAGEVVQVFQKGYIMHDKVIRAATVSVAK